MNFMNKIGEWKLFITSIGAIIFFSISSYTIYLDIYSYIEEKTTQIEITQMSLLKSQIKYLERYPCKVSRDEWAEYTMLFSQYYKLVKKYNPLLEEIEFKPMERLNKDSCKCYKGKGGCNEDI